MLNTAPIERFLNKKLSKVLFVGILLFIALGGFGLILITRAKSEPQMISASTVGSNTFTVTFFTEAKTPSELVVADNKEFKNPMVFTDTRDFTSGGNALRPTARFSHVLVARGLEPEKQYWYKVNTTFNQVGDESLFTVKTPPVSEDVPAPQPIYGHVVDKNGNSLSNILVSVQAIQADDKESSVITTYTAQNGSYSLDLSNLRTADLQDFWTMKKDVPTKIRVTAMSHKEQYFYDAYDLTALTPVETFAFTRTDSDYVYTPNQSRVAVSSESTLSKLVGTAKAEGKCAYTTGMDCSSNCKKGVKGKYVCDNPETGQDHCQCADGSSTGGSSSGGSTGGSKPPQDYSCNNNNDQNVAACCTKVNNDGSNGTCPGDKWGYCQDDVNKFRANSCGGGAPVTGGEDTSKYCNILHPLYKTEMDKHGNPCLASAIARKASEGKCPGWPMQQGDEDPYGKCGVTNPNAPASNPQPTSTPRPPAATTQPTSAPQAPAKDWCAGRADIQTHKPSMIKFVCDADKKTAIRCTDGHKWIESLCFEKSPAAPAPAAVESGCQTIMQGTTAYCQTYEITNGQTKYGNLQANQACNGFRGQTGHLKGGSCSNVQPDAVPAPAAPQSQPQTYPGLTDKQSCSTAHGLRAEPYTIGNNKYCLKETIEKTETQAGWFCTLPGADLGTDMTHAYKVTCSGDFTCDRTTRTSTMVNLGQCTPKPVTTQTVAPIVTSAPAAKPVPGKTAQRNAGPLRPNSECIAPLVKTTLPNGKTYCLNPEIVTAMANTGQLCSAQPGFIGVSIGEEYRRYNNSCGALLTCKADLNVPAGSYMMGRCVTRQQNPQYTPGRLTADRCGAPLTPISILVEENGQKVRRTHCVNRIVTGEQGINGRCNVAGDPEAHYIEGDAVMNASCANPQSNFCDVSGNAKVGRCAQKPVVEAPAPTRAPRSAEELACKDLQVGQGCKINGTEGFCTGLYNPSRCTPKARNGVNCTADYQCGSGHCGPVRDAVSGQLKCISDEELAAYNTEQQRKDHLAQCNVHEKSMKTLDGKDGWCDLSIPYVPIIRAYGDRGASCSNLPGGIRCNKDKGYKCVAFGVANFKCTDEKTANEILAAERRNCANERESGLNSDGSGKYCFIATHLGRCKRTLDLPDDSKDQFACRISPEGTGYPFPWQPSILEPMQSSGGYNSSTLTVSSGQQLPAGQYQVKDGVALNLVSPAKINFYDDKNGNGVRDEGEVIVTDASFELQKQTEAFTFEVLNGWNALNFPFYKDANTPYRASELRAIAASSGIEISSIKKWDGRWIEFSVTNGAVFGQDFSIRPNEGYFIRAHSKGTFNMFGTTPKTSVPMQLLNGWALVGVAPGYGENMSKNYNQAKFKDGIEAFEFLDVLNAVDAGINAENVTTYDNGVYRGVSYGKTKEGNRMQFGLNFGLNEQSAYFVKANKKITISP